MHDWSQQLLIQNINDLILFSHVINEYPLTTVFQKKNLENIFTSTLNCHPI